MKIAGIILIWLLAAPSQAGRTRVPAPSVTAASTQLVQSQAADNTRWRDEAVARQAELANLADQFYAAKNYAKAAEFYQQIVDLKYDQWDIQTTRSRRSTTPQPAQSRVQASLNNSVSRNAANRLREIERLVNAEREKQEQQFFERLVQQAETAAQSKDRAKAYSAYGDIIAIATREGRTKYATEAKGKAEAAQKAIIEDVSAPLSEAEELAGEGKPEEAFARMREFMDENGALLRLSPELKSRYDALETQPPLHRLTLEYEVNREIRMGDAALERQDYVGAARRYRAAGALHPDTAAARDASDKLTAMQADPAIVKAMKLQEIDAKALPTISHAEKMLRFGRYAEAKADCETVLAEYPESSHAERARAILSEIEKRTAAGEPAP